MHLEVYIQVSSFEAILIERFQCSRVIWSLPGTLGIMGLVPVAMRMCLAV